MGKTLRCLNHESALDWLSKIGSLPGVSKEDAQVLLRECMSGEDYSALPGNIQMTNTEDIMKMYEGIYKFYFPRSNVISRFYTERQCMGEWPEKYLSHKKLLYWLAGAASCDTNEFKDSLVQGFLPTLKVLKANKCTWRLTLDYQELNEVTPRLTPVVAKYQEIMATISAGAQWFSVIDLSNIFFYTPLHPELRYKFAFTFDNKQYTFSRVSQGFHNALSICHKSVTRMWNTIPEKNKIISYVNDILIATSTKEEKLRLLNVVLEKVKPTGFLINPMKAQMVSQT
ncbi:hypothetical protein KIL84_013238 [Mauremys mutica]|uniref:ribonuclease H n=1 Tax=Mauremys mutica TaxID=74926 RepID=A0A9D3WXP2_9SAUR|nr:hypothetical protein KIL84_013238 [Mauremys mutica]